MAQLTDPVTILKGVGPARAKQFANLNIFTLGDLLCHFPRGYEDRSQLVTIDHLEVDKPACFRAMVMNTPRTSHIRKGLDVTKVQVADHTARLSLTFFNSKFAAEQLQYGAEYIFYGAVSGDFIGYNMTNPTFEKPEAPAVTTRRVLPIYPLTAGLSNAAVLRAVRQALAICDPPAEILPEPVRSAYQILPASVAYQAIHEPESMAQAEQAKKRLVFEEFFVFSAGLSLMRASRAQKQTRPYADLDLGAFYEALPFRLTGAQNRAIGDILQDFARGTPMNRLVQGDVGSGKTMVAAACLWLAAKNGMQGALMAPTELLARQHYESLLPLMEQCGISCALLTGSTPKKQREKTLEKLRQGEISILIGTHALIESNVVFRRPALTITDEQHRFGVQQRQLLWDKGGDTHSLVMSATPIPRTLALMLYGDLQVSVLDELPPGRKQVETYAVPPSYRPRLDAFIQKQVQQGGQVYIVCPLIETEKGEDERQSAVAYAEALRQRLPTLSIGLMHGKLKSREKEQVMEDFAQGKIQVLVSTTVIEVGVNVPRASLMVVEDADRFGLSQLHQLRGRVGRGERQSYCVLVSASKNAKTVERLRVMTKCHDGFRIAEADLKLRGPGDFFGDRQHGLPEFKIADLSQDVSLLQNAQQAAQDLLHQDPDLSRHPLLLEKIRQLFHRCQQ